MKAITSALTIGTGGSAGQEGPVAQVGAGIGSTIAQVLRLSDRDRRLFLLSGASAGVGAMFCSPVTGRKVLAAARKLDVPEGAHSTLDDGIGFIGQVLYDHGNLRRQVGHTHYHHHERCDRLCSFNRFC